MADINLLNDSVEIRNGEDRAVFLLADGLWTPDWFYRGDRRMLRFKDHEWASVTHLSPRMNAFTAEGDALRFEGGLDYYGTPVNCTVRVEAATDGPGFVVTSTITPEGDIEVQEALTSFECPYEYDGSEESTSVLGMQPVFKHRGEETIAGLYYDDLKYFYNRQHAARMTAPMTSPLLCHKLANADGTNQRFISLLGHWGSSTFKDLYATPTRKVKHKDEREYSAVAEFVDSTQGLLGYKYIVGALNWSSSLIKDPNVIIRGGETISQKVTLAYSNDLGDKSYDEWLADCWHRALGYSFPTDGRVPAWKLASGMGIDWRRASNELTSIFRQKEIPGLWDETKGIVVYIDGTRPKAGGHSRGFTLQWLAPLSYRARLLGDDALLQRTVELADLGAPDIEKSNPTASTVLGAMFFMVLPAMQYLRQAPVRSARLEQALRGYLDRCAELLRTDIESVGDFGMVCTATEALLVGGEVFGEAAYTDAALTAIDYVNSNLHERFWYFGCKAGGGKDPAGKQLRPIGAARAIISNILASKATGDSRYLNSARAMANYLLAIAGGTYNFSPAPDLDTRGWAAGANSGRDQLAECPPMETCDGMRAVAALLNKVEPHPAYYDAIFLIARTGLAMLPAARTHKRIYNTDGKIEYVKTDEFPNERSIYARFPFVSYENPWDQTLQAPYQGVEPLMNYLTFGGGLAEVDDDRLLAIVPDVPTYGYDGKGRCEAHVWNPTNEAIKSKLTFNTRPADAEHTIVMSDGSNVTGNGAKAIEINVPARTALKVFC